MSNIISGLIGYACGYFGRMLQVWLERRAKSKQTTFCYCKNCMNELCGDPTTACYDLGNGEVHYICGKCKWQTDFLFDAPVPIFLRVHEPQVPRGA